MSRAINEVGRLAAVLGLAGALMLQLGLPAAADAPSNLQLAQAPSPGGSPPGGGDQIGELQRSLQITPAQQPQFDAFAQAMRQNEAAMNDLVQRFPTGQQRTALAELQAQSQAADIEAQGLRRLVPVFQALYTVLSDEQKRTADQMFVGPPPGAQSPGGR